MKHKTRNMKNKEKVPCSMKQEGFTIAEIIIAISLLGFGMFFVYGVFYTSISANYTAASRFEAAYLAQEGLEIVKNIRDNNVIGGVSWSDGLLDGSCLALNGGCMVDYTSENSNQLSPYNDATFLTLNTDDGFYGYDPTGLPTIFKRKITTVPMGDANDVAAVTVLISWNYNGQPLSFRATEYLYNLH